jgi:hypothetical protein
MPARQNLWQARLSSLSVGEQAGVHPDMLYVGIICRSPADFVLFASRVFFGISGDAGKMIVRAKITLKRVFR